MNVNSVAKPYSKALYEFAKETNSINDFKDALESAVQIFNNEDFKKLQSLPSGNKTLEIEVLLKVVSKKISNKITNFFTALADHGKLSLIPIIAEQYSQLVLHGNNKHKAVVHTALEISKTQQKKLVEKLEKYYDSKIEISFQIDPSLLCGAIVRMDNDQVFDASLSNRLNKLKSLLTD